MPTILVSMVARDTIAPIQALRAVAALIVCVAHAYGQIHWLPSELSFGVVGVDIFFVISGFIIVYSSETLFERPNGPETFFIRRLIRIVPLYWLCCTILIAWVVANGGLGAKHWPLSAVIANYFFIPVNYPDAAGIRGDPFYGIGWTLLYEMLFYFAFGIAMWTRSRQASIAVAALVLVSLILIGLTFDLPQPLRYWSKPITLEFIYGMLIATAFRSDIRFTAPVGVLIAALGLTLLILFKLGTGLASPPMRGILSGIPAALIVASAALTPLHKTDGRGWKFALFWGGASYSLYLVHPLAFLIPKHVPGGRFGQLSVTHPYLGLAMLISGALVIAALTHLFFEKPITAVLRNRASSIVSLITSLRTHGSASKSEAIYKT